MHRRTCAVLTVAALVTLAPAPAPAQTGPEATDFFVTWGLRQAEHTLGEDGREITLYRPAGALNTAVEMALVSDPSGSLVSAVLRVDRALFAVDRETALQLVGSYVHDAVSFDDQSETAGLRAMIVSDDPAARQGETERSRGCCALPPVPARDVAAVAVVDGRRGYALVRLRETSIRFRASQTLDGRPALVIAVSGPEGPGEVVEAVFDAARHDDDAWLLDLCGFGVEIQQGDRLASGCRATEGEVGDVHAVTTHRATQGADDTGHVLVCGVKHMRAHLGVDVDALDLDEARLAVGETCSGNR
ncbi:MAG: hypothetical protein RLN75_06735, partial [Longimicrobiales bacterium]